MPGRQFFSSSTYRYGFNGKENDKETVGTNNGTQDYGMRIYNPSLGRWLSIDPQASKYAYSSPFSAFGNNPEYYIDPGGETLSVHIFSDAKAVEHFRTTIQKEFSEKVTVKIKDGIVSFHKLPNAVLTKTQQKQFDYLFKRATEKGNTEIGIQDNDANIIGGSFSITMADGKQGFRNILDVSDLKMLKSKHASVLGAVIHEIEESYQTQVKGVKGSNRDETYKQVHEKAKTVQGAVEGITYKGEGGYVDKNVTGVAYKNFTVNGEEFHFDFKIEKGKITSFDEVKGFADKSKYSKPKYEKK